MIVVHYLLLRTRCGDEARGESETLVVVFAVGVFVNFRGCRGGRFCCGFQRLLFVPMSFGTAGADHQFLDNFMSATPSIPLLGSFTKPAESPVRVNFDAALIFFWARRHRNPVRFRPGR